MQNNGFLIPANSKKSQLILGFLNKTDLTILITGVTISIFLLLMIKSSEIGVMVALVSPALIAIFLVAPVPNYHNIRTLIGNIISFYTGRKKYYWRGWCANNGERDSK